MKGMRTWSGLCLFVILAGAVAFRFFKLDVLPSWNSDEGRWVLGAMQAIRYGDVVRGGADFALIAPVWAGITYVAFLVYEPGILVARFVSAGLGVLAVLLLYGLAVECGYNRRVALVAALFLALDGSFAVINRTARPDTVLTVLLLAGFWLYKRGGVIRSLSSVLFAAALCTKVTAVVGLAVVYVVGFCEHLGSGVRRLQTWLRPAVLPVLAIGISGTVFGLLYLDSPKVFVNVWKFVLFSGTVPLEPHGFLDAIKYYALRMPLLLLLGGIGVAHMVWRRRLLHGLPLAWLLIGVAVIAVQKSQPARYYIPMIPPLCLAAAWAVDVVFFSAETHIKRKRIVGGVWVAAILVFSVGTWAFYYFGRDHVDATGRDVTNWINEHVDPEDAVMAISTYGIGITPRFYPQEYYNNDLYLSDEEIKTYGIRYVVYDDPEWRKLAEEAGSGFDAQLQERFKRVTRIGKAELWMRKDE